MRLDFTSRPGLGRGAPTGQPPSRPARLVARRSRAGRSRRLSKSVRTADGGPVWWTGARGPAGGGRDGPGTGGPRPASIKKGGSDPDFWVPAPSAFETRVDR